MMPIDQESMVRAVQLDSKISEGMYTRLGEDVGVLKKRITSDVTRSIAMGATYEQTARLLAGQTRIGFNKSIRIARTEGHRIQCQATMDACHQAKDRGADVVKQWDATLDGRTRASHRHVDGEIRELDEPFSNGLMYPGDPAGGAAEVVNCRCALLQRARWALSDEEFTKMNGETGELMHFKNVTEYSEFKKEFFKQSKVVETKQGLQKKALTKPVESDNSLKIYTKKQLDGMSLVELRKIAAETALKYYESGISGISFGKANMKEVAWSLANQGSATSLKKDIMAMQKKMKATNILTNTSQKSKTKLPDIEIHKSVGAKAKNYDVMDLTTGEMFKFAEGTKIQDVEVFAGKGTHTTYRNADRYAEKYGGNAEDWQHVKGVGRLETSDGDIKAEVHWSQCEKIGKFDFFVKRWLE